MLALSLAGCGTPLPPSAQNCPALPPMPFVATQTPPVSYSASAKTDIQNWQKRLTDSIATGKH
jgi:hypothetical protein